jgi:hypothetical protein
MKILNPYRFYKGHGGSGSSTIPALVPPPSGTKLLKSISVAEVVDLLCEGPIYGLVDQFGKKVYGLDMLKGIYLNKVPVMNYDGKYNFRNVVMEINLGTEDQKPLANFNNVYIYKPANFKLLGPITTSRDIRPIYEQTTENGIPIGGISGQTRLGGGDFTGWATGWPNQAKDPFIYTHHIKNKDVKKIRLSMIVESLFDTIDQGTSKGQAGRMGMSKETTVTIRATWGVEGTNKIVVKDFPITGVVTSPYACMIGEPISQADMQSASGTKASSGTGTLLDKNTIVTPTTRIDATPRLPIAPEPQKISTMVVS